MLRLGGLKVILRRDRSSILFQFHSCAVTNWKMGEDSEHLQPEVQETTIRSRLFNIFEITLLFAATAVGAVVAVTVAMTKVSKKRFLTMPEK